MLRGPLDQKAIDDIENDHDNSNILIFTMQYEKFLDEFFHYEKSYLKVLCPFIDRLELNNRNGDGLLAELESSGIIVNSGTVGVDEVSNLLMRKKFIEKCPEFEALCVSKVYPIAERIKRHITQEKKYFESIPFKNAKRDDPIVGLLKRLKEGAFLSEVIDQSKLCKPSLVKKNDSLDNLYVERITHTYQKRYEEIGSNPFEKLERLIGLDDVKRRVKVIANRIKHPAGGKKAKVEPGHYMFVGNPGTGKTEVARLMAEILHSINALSKGTIVEVDRSKLVADHIGGTEKKTRAYCEEALGGVLFVDEAYTLYNGDSEADFGKEALQVIMKYMEDNRSDLTVIFAGYKNKMIEMMKANQGIKSRISDSNIVEFPDYTAEELTEILKLMGEDRGYELTDGFVSASKELFEQWEQNKTEEFGNAREVRNFLNRADGRRALRIADLEANGYAVDDDDNNRFVSEDAIEQLMHDDTSNPFEKLDRLIGLSEPKRKVREIADCIKYPAGGKKAKVEPGHYMFVGNPGTGKTEVARLMAEILHSINALSKGTIVEVDRSKLVADHIGGTEKKTRAYCEEALGGVLFVDEAYTLYNGDSEADFGKEALQVIMKYMEDNRSDLTVIFAGYKNKMIEMMRVNPGIKSRISDSNIVEFPDYTAEELTEILKLMGEDRGYELTDGFVNASKELFERWEENKTEEFGNARDVRNYLNEANARRAHRISKLISEGNEVSESEISRFIAEDANEYEIR